MGTSSACLMAMLGCAARRGNVRCFAEKRCEEGRDAVERRNLENGRRRCARPWRQIVAGAVWRTGHGAGRVYGGGADDGGDVGRVPGICVGGRGRLWRLCRPVKEDLNTYRRDCDAGYNTG